MPTGAFYSPVPKPEILKQQREKTLPESENNKKKVNQINVLCIFRAIEETCKKPRLISVCLYIFCLGILKHSTDSN